MGERTPTDTSIDRPDGQPLAALAAAAGLTLDSTALDRFADYRSLLVRWNDRFNLTAIHDPHEVDRRLFLDALRMLPTVEATTSGLTRPRLVDVGSGAGFPGLALKIARPDLDVTLIEATGKKVNFLEACLHELELDRVVALHGRAEDYGHDPAFRGQFDLATARAVAGMPVLLELCAPLLRLGGWALLPKGLNLSQEIEAGRRAAPLVGARIIGGEILPGGHTTLVVVEKVSRTPERYPRRPGVPAREPLDGSRDARLSRPAKPAPANASRLARPARAIEQSDRLVT